MTERPLTPGEARHAIEELRKGIPPTGHVRRFTVGRTSELSALERRLTSDSAGALLLKANYGAGKTHLLRLIKEIGLAANYAVSWISVDSQAGVRFNRMDQILGAVCRGLSLPGEQHPGGIRSLLDLAVERADQERGRRADDGYWAKVSHRWAWDFSRTLKSPAMFVAMRAWCTRDQAAQDLVEDWLGKPWVYQTQRKQLYVALVEQLRRHFREPRNEWQFYADGVFVFNTQGYLQSWAALQDLHEMAVACGLRGLIILFDEFEDVITNLGRINWQEAAFWNLFHFFSGEAFPGQSYFAVTPEFVHKCKDLLLGKGRWDYDYGQFEQLTTFQMSPLSGQELETLADRIQALHATAYGWVPQHTVPPEALRRIVRDAAKSPVEDRTRVAIISLVKALDAGLEDAT